MEFCIVESRRIVLFRKALHRRVSSHCPVMFGGIASRHVQSHCLVLSHNVQSHCHVVCVMFRYVALFRDVEFRIVAVLSIVVSCPVQSQGHVTKCLVALFRDVEFRIVAVLSNVVSCLVQSQSKVK